MRLSVVFELLLIFLIIAFAAYGRVVPENKVPWNTGLIDVKEHLKMMGRARQANVPQAAPPNRYCACSNLMCNCCRDFSLPVVPIKGPGCASLKYLKGDQMMVTMSFGDRVLRNTTISGKKPKPVCMALPGGISKFCGRVYGISRDGDQFKACLGLELRALDDVEAALRVSCFRFGPQGMKVEPAQPLPASQTLQGEDEEDEEDDDDEDDDYGLGGSDDEDEDDDDAVDEDSENDVESTGDADYTGLSALSTDFLDSLFGGGGAEEDQETETSAAKPTVKPAVTVKAKATTPQSVTSQQQQVTEKQLQQSSAESVTSTSYTVSVVQDSGLSSSSSSEVYDELRPTAIPLNDSPTDRVETVPATVTAAVNNKNKDKDYDDDDDDDDDDDEDIVSDIIETSLNAVGMSDTADKNSTTSSVVATTKSAVADKPAVTTEAASTSTTDDSGPAGKDYDDDDEDDDDGFRSFKQFKYSAMPVAIVPNDRRGRTHRRMRLSSLNEESSIHFMKKV